MPNPTETAAKSAAKPDQPTRVFLKEEFIHNGQWYGPGEIEVADKSVADDLVAAQARIDGIRNPPPVLKPNGLTAGVLPGTDAPLNGTTADDFRKQAEASEDLAKKKAEEEAAAKKAVAEAKAGK